MHWPNGLTNLIAQPLHQWDFIWKAWVAVDQDAGWLVDDDDI
jgi:hypothetical protein